MSSFASELDECLTRDLKHLYEVEAVPLYSSTKQENVQQPQSSSPGLLLWVSASECFWADLVDYASNKKKLLN